ncbi:unnamed protein product (macronuclear) [Paramecium tetraurelia]|uniref:Cyclic nucleotide-binding domain-containing protein n=1 Tax=Paramecium tetraurelia TaxID=5888 RepID=A0DXU0_PARTE|nr:uncharacterized protein GSPATT00021481001 [Paramecium tetraurelia]CAK87857.1 unnamed protein product [Paramecium tetraurelia]|eukprot:XP_001455254.1 hypothetical protein (macronuclear) [Paramecium tetraurelia strain d4-2]
MTTFLQSTFTISEKPNYEFLLNQVDSDSDNERQKQKLQQVHDHQKEHKKFKKLIDIELVKEELKSRPNVEKQLSSFQKKSISKIKSVRSLNDLIMPTSPVLMDQLGNLNKIKEIRSEVPPELMGRIYSEFRYEFVSALNPVYRQGDQNKRFYIVLEGKVVVMKPKLKMVGSSKIEFDDNLKQKNQGKTEDDPFGLKILFPDYIILKILFPGDSFGEAAIKLDTTRSSTVFTLEDTHLIYLNETAYLEYINPYLSIALDKKMKYFGSTPLFQNISTEDYMGIVLESKMITMKAGDLFYEEGEKTKYLYFIMNGEIELLKKVGSKSIILSSYGEFQCFGEVEIMMKINRYTKAKVISPRVNCYKIRKRRFFDNLGSFGTYENMKKHSSVIYKHWQLICNSVQKQINPRDEVYEAAQNDNKNRPNLLASSILNKKVIESQGQKLSQIKVFQNLADQKIKDLKQFSSDNQYLLQRVYSNTLQQYQAKLLKKPQLAFCDSDASCIRNQNQNKQLTNLSINHDDNSTRNPLNENSIDLKLSSNRSSVFIKRESQQKISLPSLHPSLHFVRHEPQSLNSVLESISKLPRVPKDNLVLSLMYQQAYKAENPTRKAREIQQECIEQILTLKTLFNRDLDKIK